MLGTSNSQRRGQHLPKFDGGNNLGRDCAKEESDNVRTIHDGTVVNVNPHIQEHIPERQTYPMQEDLFTTLAALEHPTYARCYGKGTNVKRHVLLKFDVSKAHRHIKVAQENHK